jgi:pimeloyl-ACP methyl ester carboxylesterase
MPFAQSRDAALCHGFAWAASSAERYGIAVAELMRSTHLLGVVAARHLDAAPTRTFVTGLFMPGGLAALALAETYPHRYAGAVVVNAPVAGMLQAIDHVRHVASLFDVFVPGLVEFEPERGMMPAEFAAFGAALHERIMADPSILQRMAAIHLPDSERYDPAGVGHAVLWPDPTAPDAETAFVSTGQALGQMMWNALVLGADVRERGGGRCAGDNQHAVYRGAGWSPEEEADLNARVPRQAGDALAQRYWTFHYQPSGALEIPLVSIRGPWGQVPSQHWAYADRLSRSGGNDFYSEWALQSHEQEDLRQNMGTALRALLEWIETGVRPVWPTMP